MGPTWVLLAPDGPHIGPLNLAFREVMACSLALMLALNCGICLSSNIKGPSYGFEIIPVASETMSETTLWYASFVFIECLNLHNIYIYICNGLCLSTLPQRVVNTHMRGECLHDIWFYYQFCILNHGYWFIWRPCASFECIECIKWVK